MIRGVVNSDGVPTIAVSVAGREWTAIIDTGFNGDLELPESLRRHVNARFTTDVVSQLAGGQQITEPAYDVAFPFDGFNVAAEATFVGDMEILLGTGLLRDYRLEVDFVARTVLLERLAHPLRIPAMAASEREPDSQATLPPSDPDSTATIAPSGTSHTSSVTAGLPHIPGYELLSVLGQGGMGVVYKARHKKLHRVVALKMIRGSFIERDDQRARFVLEAEAVARLQHVNIVQIFEIGDVVLGDGSVAPFMALEFVEGASLDSHLDGKPMTPPAAAELVADLAHAMAFAHEHNIIHRDLKPANILLGKLESGSKSHHSVDLKGRRRRADAHVHFCPKISDFGLAKQIDVNSSQTKAGEIMGTPSYMAPEQAEANPNIGPPADIYALGAILYELLTGRPPFRAATSLDTIFQVLGQEPVAPSKLQPGIPKDVETICLKCLEKSPTKRYPSADELADDLERFLGDEPIRARPTGVVEKTWKWAKRRPAAAALVVVSALALVAGVAGGIWFTRTVSLERDAALSAEAKATQAKELADDKAREAQKHLDQLAIATGLRLTDSGDLFAGMVWFTRPLGKEVVYRAHESANRDRITHYLKYSQRPTLRHNFLHQGAVYHAAFSPDGRKVVTSSADKTAQVWDAETGESIGPPLQHKERVLKSIFSPDSRLVATFCGDKTARIWDAATGAARSEGLPHGDEVFDGEFSKDGRMLISFAMEQKTVHVWDTATGQPLGVLDHDDEVNCATFAPDGKTIAVAIGKQAMHDGAPPGPNGAVHFWNPATLMPARPPLKFNTTAWHLNFSADGQRLAVTRFHDRVQVWPTAGADSPLIDIPRTAARQARLTPDGRRLIAFVQGREAFIYDAATGKEAAAKPESNDMVRTYDVSPDGRTLVIGGDDKLIRPYSVDTGLATGPPLPQRDYVSFTTFSPEGRRLLAASSDNSARMWDLASDHVRPTAGWHLNWVFGFSMSADETRIVSYGMDKRMGVWDTRTLAPLGPLIEHPGWVREARFSRDGRFIVSACADGILRLWDAATLALIREYKGHEQKQIPTVRFSPDGEFFCSTCNDGTARVWETATGHCLQVLKGEGAVHCGDLSPDGTRYVTVGQDKLVRVWNPKTGELYYPPLTDHTNQVFYVAFSPDGRRFATTGFDFTARVWETATGKSVGKPMRHDGTVAKVNFSKDGRRVATAGEDNTVRLWDVETGQPVAPTLAHPAWTHDAVFTADGARLITGMRRKAARFWNAHTGQPISPNILHPGGRVFQTTFTADESHFITCTLDGGVFLWPVVRDDRPAEDLVRVVEAHQGWRIDSFGGFATIADEDYRALWADMRNRYPQDFSVSDESRRLWHREEMRAALREKKPFAAGLHAYFGYWAAGR